jgi:hypothetical protein
VGGAGDGGFDIEGVGNTLNRNKASGSGGYDLDDERGLGANTYGAGANANKFKTAQVWLNV